MSYLGSVRPLGFRTHAVTACTLEAGVNGGSNRKGGLAAAEALPEPTAGSAGSSRDSRLLGSEGAAPSEGWEKLETLHSLQTLRSRIRSADSEESLSQIFAAWDERKKPLVALASSCKLAQRDLESAMACAARAAIKEKEKKDKEKERHASKGEGGPLKACVACLLKLLH